MGSDKIIVTVHASWALGLGRLRRKFGHALHCSDVVGLLCGREFGPASVSPSTLLAAIVILPFSSGNNISGIAFLVLICRSSILIGLLLDAGDSSIKVGSQKFPAWSASCQVFPLVDREVIESGNGIGRSYGSHSGNDDSRAHDGGMA